MNTTLSQLYSNKIFKKRTEKSEHIQKRFRYKNIRDHNSVNFMTFLNLIDFFGFIY